MYLYLYLFSSKIVWNIIMTDDLTIIWQETLWLSDARWLARYGTGFACLGIRYNTSLKFFFYLSEICSARLRVTLCRHIVKRDERDWDERKICRRYKKFEGLNWMPSSRRRRSKKSYCRNYKGRCVNCMEMSEFRGR